MKKTLKKLTSALLCALMLVSVLVSCDQVSADDTGNTDKPYENQGNVQQQITSGSPSTSTPSGTPNSDSSGTANDINVDSYKEQIAYYMSLVEALQVDILKLREEAYIDECEYQLKISTLEDTVEMLKKTVASLSGDNSTSGSTHVPPNDNLAVKTDYKYIINDGKITITEYTGKDIDVNIPSTIDGKPVVKIGEGAFSETQIRKVAIPSGVKEIDWFAFSGCTVLESILIPTSVTSVGYGAFDYCPKTLVIKCEKGSYIEAYALSWGMKITTQ